MSNPNDRALAQLQTDWPRWEVWIVYRAVGPATWCARLRDDHQKVINAHSAGELGAYLEDEVSEPLPALDMPMTGADLRAAYGDRWAIERNPLGVWTAEQSAGSEVRYLVARRAWELAAKIDAAENAGQ